MSKNIPIGISNFAKLIDKDENFLFVDKSLMIKDLLDKGAEVSLIIRPRRWGKTLNMSMLQYFFAPEVQGKPTQGMFDEFKIAKVQEGAYLKKQGAYPVIFISFKRIKQSSWDRLLSSMGDLIAETYREHRTVLMQSDQLSEDEKTRYKNILNKRCDQSALEGSIKFLSECLYRHYKKEVIILIDEYDTPLNASYSELYFDQLTEFFKIMLGEALKGNPFLKKGVMTGILRLSKNKMLSDLNNLVLYSLVDKQYSQHFGFSEQEVKDLLLESNTSVDMKELQSWYNGYRSGTYTDIYNPWSILSCIRKNGELEPYWIRTGDEDLLKDAFSKVPESVEEELAQLLARKSIQASIDEYISFDQIKDGSSMVLWSLLWTTGYLKFSEPPTSYCGALSIPNEEVYRSYKVIFPKWVRTFNPLRYDSFLKNLISGDIEAFACELKKYMLTVPSYFDFPKESDYHAFLLGLTASLEESHKIRSNKETGLGRVDMLLIPKDLTNDLGIILEFKREKSGKNLSKYEQVAREGLLQIDAKKYSMALNSVSHIQKILKCCIVFYGKEFVYQSSFE